MKLLGENVDTAASHVVEELGCNKGEGGVIALDNEGNCELIMRLSIEARDLTKVLIVSLSLNSSGMYRGVIKADGSPKVAIFDDEEVE